MRSALKRRIEAAFSSPVARAVGSRRVRGKCLILAYHGILPDGALPAGERSLFVRQRDFSAQLDILAELVDVVPLDKLAGKTNGKPRVAITFDDAYRGALNEGVAELTKRQMPATIFVAPGRLNSHTFWWDALCHTQSELEAAVRSYALSQLRGCDERVREWAVSEHLTISEDVPSYAQSGTVDELRSAVINPGITVGSHSWSHPNLSQLSQEEVLSELEQSRDWLRSEFGRKALPWLSFPYGLDSSSVRVAAQTAHYHGAVRIGGGWYVPERVSPFACPRLSMSANMSLKGFRARICGAMGA